MNTLEKIIKHTGEQLAIFAWVALGIADKASKHLIIIARAGCGKTSTIIEAIKHSKAQRIIYLAFMSRNASEAKAKIQDDRVHVATCNAIGNQILNRKLGFGKPDKWAEWNRAKQVCPELKEKQYIVALIARLVSRCKNSFIGVPEIKDVIDIANKIQIQVNDKDLTLWPVSRLAEITIQVMQLSLQKSFFRSFDDQLWQALTLGLVTPEFDLVLVDEGQDLNALNFEFAMRLVNPNGSIVIVGDDLQSMYTFRGALPNGLEIMKDKLSADVLKLTQTFRVPKSGVADVIGLCPDLVAAESNVDGEVIKNMTVDTMTSLAKTGHAIVSRTNAPLMPHALEFIRKGKPARIEGKEIGRDLINIVESLGDCDISHFVDRLGTWEQASIAKAGTGRDSAARCELISDKAETLRVLAESESTVQGICAKILSLFQDTHDAYSPPKPAIVLSTVHKAKGLEWDTVYILTETFSKSRKPVTPEEVEEEKHIRYVSQTRHWNKVCHVIPNPK